MSATIHQIDRRWRDRLQLTGNGVVRKNLFNACLMIREAPELRGRIAYDEFAMRTVVVAPLPWDEDSGIDYPRPWTNHDDNACTLFAQAAPQDIDTSRDIIQQAVETVAYEARFHPVRQYLAGLKWDGVPRVDTWMTYYLGADLTPYSQAVGKCTLVAAVARIMLPGCKADHVPILEGDQGIGKSQAVSILGGEWFTDELADFGSKDAAMQMRGKWLIELGELDQLIRADPGRTKAWISRQVDRFRPPYGARLVDAPRECVFIGTTNPRAEGYLKDETGNRRFWPVRCGAIDHDALRRDRDQLWAEARVMFEHGEKWWLDDPDLIADAATEQRAREEEDVWMTSIAAWLADQARSEFRTADILGEAVNLKPADRTSGHARRVARIMTQLGYRQVNSRGGIGGRRWVRAESV